ncbi:MAG: hypothetical protein ABF854_01820 [Gluconacetobacter sp.]
MPKLIVIDPILIPLRNPRHAPEHQGANVMRDKMGCVATSRVFSPSRRCSSTARRVRGGNSASASCTIASCCRCRISASGAGRSSGRESVVSGVAATTR